MKKAVRKDCFFLVRAWGLEPQRKAQEPKSCMSTNSIMPAYFPVILSGAKKNYAVILSERKRVEESRNFTLYL